MTAKLSAWLSNLFTSFEQFQNHSGERLDKALFLARIAVFEIPEVSA